jgi:predicted phosphoribosyltransferase
VVINDDVVRGLQISPQQLREIIYREAAELIRREAVYRGERAPVDVGESFRDFRQVTDDEVRELLAGR